MLSQTTNNTTDDNETPVKFQTEVNTKAMPVKKTKQTTTNKTLHAQNEVEDHKEKVTLNKVPQGDYTLTSTGNDIKKDVKHIHVTDDHAKSDSNIEILVN